jgi:carbamoyl-phosphate synthase large subunit
MVKPSSAIGGMILSKRGSQQKNARDVRVLFTCIGRRVSLLDSFRLAAKKLRMKASFFGADSSELSPALQKCDKIFLVKPTSDPKYIDELLSIVKTNNVKLLVPTVDLDLKVLARNKESFAAAGCRVLVSEPHVIDICQDKRKTYGFFVKNGFDSPLILSVSNALSQKDSMKKLGWPCFVKPWDGCAAKGNALANNRDEVRLYSRIIPTAFCQERVEGTEFTCDVYVDFRMKVRCIVPRIRMEVRSGEVSKGQVVKDPRIMSEAARLTEILRAGPGVITLQLFLTEDNRLRFIEVNPRFGGGVPLSIKAGADFPKWILQELVGSKPNIGFDGFKNNLIMLRYDAEVWLKNSR